MSAIASGDNVYLCQSLYSEMKVPSSFAVEDGDWTVLVTRSLTKYLINIVEKSFEHNVIMYNYLAETGCCLS